MNEWRGFGLSARLTKNKNMLIDTLKIIDPDCVNGFRIINAEDMREDDELFIAKRAYRKSKSDDLPDTSAQDDTTE